MPNNPARDMYNPKPTNATDFESFRFGEIPVGQLFWVYNDDRPNNIAYRKVTEEKTENSLHTRNRLIVDFDANDIVYQKI
mgnify:FL=1|tara:strand:+ start:177 stop:416 length:240 start_codon:yes stop_codon:yes gene_type:complete